MNKDLVAIFEYLEREKGIKREIVVAAIQESLEQAAKSSVHDAENVSVAIHPRTGEIEVYCDKIVVEKVSSPMLQISYKEAPMFSPGCSIGQVIRVPITPKDFGRVAAQKARQIISQKLRGAEKDVIQEEYRHRVNSIVSGTVKRVGRGACVIVDLGKVEGVMPRRNYLPQENFNVGNKVLALLSEVRETESGGAEVVLSRSSPEFVRQLLIQETPEISDGTVVIENIVREPGYRTKIVVRSQDPKVDPVGACIGVRGSRIKNVIRELGGEKLDVIPYIADLEGQLIRALEPVVVRRFQASEDGRSISIVVDDEDFAKAIGQKGMNVRLLGQLVDIQLTVQKMGDYVKLRAIERASLASSDDPTLDLPLSSFEGIPKMVIDQLVAEGFPTPRSLLLASPEAIEKIAGIGLEITEKIFEQIRKQRA